MSILTIISKIFDRVVFDQVESYPDKKTSQVSGAGIRLTRHVFDSFTDFIKFQMNKGHFVRIVLLDLQKAFDTVDHSTRGISKVLRMVFYLSNRFTNPIMFGIISKSYLSSMLSHKFYEDIIMRTRTISL